MLTRGLAAVFMISGHAGAVVGRLALERGAVSCQQVNAVWQRLRRER